MLQEAKAEIDLLGPNAALSGKNENDSSGRAILAQQQGGMVEVALLMDRLRMLSLSVYRAIWARIKQYWTGQRWIRVTDDERDLQWVGLNQPRTVADLIGAALKGDANAMRTVQQKLPQAVPVLQAAMQGDQEAQFKLGVALQDPRSQAPVHVDNPVAEMDVDIILDEGMDTPTVQAEQFETLTKIAPGIVNLPPPIVKMLVMASSLRDKDKILEELDKMGQSQGDPMQAQMQAQAQQLQIEMQMKQAEMQQQAQLEREQIAARAQADIEAEKIKAQVSIEAARIKAEASKAIEGDKARIEAEANHYEMARQEQDTSRSDALQEQIRMIAEAMQHLSRPRRKVPVRDANGFITELRDVLDDAA
jgi:hypothetical protein